MFFFFRDGLGNLQTLTPTPESAFVVLALTLYSCFVCVSLYLLLPSLRIQGPGKGHSSTGDFLLRVLPGHVPSPEGVPHVHHRRDPPHAGALHQLRDASSLAEGVSRYFVRFFLGFSVFSIVLMRISAVVLRVPKGRGFSVVGKRRRGRERGQKLCSTHAGRLSVYLPQSGRGERER